ncbi:MAG TPA: pantoate--beta-alanine ligase [Myxococcota bacterium]|nr:pantoate--beta-alanine ligase [Myxococcota bacterium]
MEIVREPRALQAWADRARAAGRRIALVPTMGALHDGHVALVDEARRRADLVVVSIFVNPTQFGPGEDFAAYPRPFEADLERCRAAGVDVVFAPAPEALYPPGHQTFVDVERVSKPLCGASRPGHFRGVATVVTKLWLAAKPHVSLFGEKDYQQLALLRRLALDLGFDLEVVGVPTVREPDGLARSSRNVFLDAETRAQALALRRALRAAEDAVAAGERDGAALLAGVRRELAKAPLAEVDYAELRDAETLEPAPARLDGPTLLALAVRFPAESSPRGVRLIDNTVLRPAAESAEGASS